MRTAFIISKQALMFLTLSMAVGLFSSNKALATQWKCNLKEDIQKEQPDYKCTSALNAHVGIAKCYDENKYSEEEADDNMKNVYVACKTGIKSISECANYPMKDDVYRTCAKKFKNAVENGELEEKDAPSDGEIAACSDCAIQMADQFKDLIFDHRGTICKTDDAETKSEISDRINRELKKLRKSLLKKNGCDKVDLGYTEFVLYNVTKALKSKKDSTERTSDCKDLLKKANEDLINHRTKNEDTSADSMTTLSSEDEESAQ